MIFLTYIFIIILTLIISILIYKSISKWLNYKKDIQNNEHYRLNEKFGLLVNYFFL